MGDDAVKVRYKKNRTPLVYDPEWLPTIPHEPPPVLPGPFERCADCPYPEVVYTDYTGERPMRYLTGRMTFVNDKLAMVLAENAGTCSRCGRSFSLEALRGGRCGLCSGIEGLSGADREEAKKRYFKYRNAFSHGVRMRHIFDDKVCLEDDTALVFALGNETYVLNKSDLTGDDGFIAQPVRIR